MGIGLYVVALTRHMLYVVPLLGGLAFDHLDFCYVLVLGSTTVGSD
jgi:hypothetical protein